MKNVLTYEERCALQKITLQNGIICATIQTY